MKFKEEPEDFKVEEIINLKLRETGDYAYVLLKKKDWTTARAIKTIARRLRVSKTRIGFAGNKDKNAVTSQVISIWKTKKEAVERLNIKDIELEFLGCGDSRINLGNHEKNKFLIRLRGVSAKELEVLDKRLDFVKRNGFPNYFGAQRFGSSENSHLIGKHIILGNFERAVKRLLGKNPGKNWKKLLDKTRKSQRMERAVLHHLIKYSNDYAGALRKIEKPTRRIFVHAYQSWIFNKALSELVGEKAKCSSVAQLGIKLNFPLEKAGKLPEVFPILGTKSKLGRDKFSRACRKILKEECLDLEDFACSRMPELASEGTERRAFAVPESMEIKQDGSDLIISFELEKGVYATVLLTALFLKSFK